FRRFIGIGRGRHGNVLSPVTGRGPASFGDKAIAGVHGGRQKRGYCRLCRAASPTSMSMKQATRTAARPRPCSTPMKRGTYTATRPRPCSQYPPLPPPQLQ
ncbi:unnamed protein product, partial [Ectocarpus sp. 6 AP-2014]